MPLPGGSPGLVEVARRWTARLAETDGVNLPAAELERLLVSVAEEAGAEAAAEREAAARRLTALYSASPLGVILTDDAGTILDVNPALTTVLGYDARDLMDRHVAVLGATDADRAALTEIYESLPRSTEEPRRERLELEHATEGPLRTYVTVAGLPGDSGESLYPVVMIEDISELHLLRDALRKQNVQDPLTGLPNSGSFGNRLEATLAAPGEGQIALLYFDIDGFKVINDGLGPGAGDEVLRHVARTLDAAFAAHDGFVARLSGDGFAVLLRGELTSAGVIDLVEDVMAELAEPKYVEGKGIGVSVSVGIVVQDAEGRTQEDLHRAAEITLHRAKHGGRAQWMLFESELDRADRRRFGIGAVIGGALENGEFELRYQPTVKLDGSGQIAVVNATLRWNHPDHGWLRPTDFYPLADVTGLTLNLGKWLLSESVAEAARWHTEFSAPPDLCVRLPNRLAIDPNLVAIIRGELERSGLSPQKLRVCTDSSALFDPRGEVQESLSVLSELDVKIALAVTGAADLELAHAQKLPVGFVILSGPLIEGLGREGDEGEGARKHLSTLLERAGDLGITRVGAEGVHTPEHARRLRELGVIAGRGDLFGRAATGAEVRRQIAEHG